MCKSDIGKPKKRIGYKEDIKRIMEERSAVLL